MTTSRLAQSYAYCERIARREAGNFYTADEGTVLAPHVVTFHENHPAPPPATEPAHVNILVPSEAVVTPCTATVRPERISPTAKPRRSGATTEVATTIAVPK